ncbi:PDZ domain-containing protein [Streptomyces sp. NPDC093261]|uniref:PDZ domain-containing protein n=1 Tax=Streptomyces sp. NPDC093261 TaxID=3366037 RepID=UPI00382606DC
MDQGASRPDAVPGRESGEGRPSGPARRPHAPARRGGRLTTLLCVLVVGMFMVLSGVGLGTVGATVTGMSRLAQVKRHAAASGRITPSVSGGRSPGTGRTPAHTTSAAARGGGPGPAPAPSRPSLGIEAVDAASGGALLVGVHVPGPGHTAGLVRGDVLLALDETRLGSAADLARAIAAVRPGTAVTLTVRHADGTHALLTATPGVPM